MNDEKANLNQWMERFYKPVNEALLKEKCKYKLLHRKDHCWWCGKEFKKDEVKVTHGIFNYLGVYFCDNNKCLGDLIDCNNLQYKEINYHPKGTSI